MFRDAKEYQRQDPGEDVRPREPVNTGGADQENHSGGCQEKVAAEEERQSRGAPCRERDRERCEQCDRGQAAELMSGTHSDIGEPFPGKPFAARTRVRKAVGHRCGAGCKNCFSVANMPAGVAVAEESLGTLREKE